jgi:hypothetical protein
MELETKRFYETAAGKATDAGIRQLLGDLATEERKHATTIAETMAEVTLAERSRGGQPNTLSGPPATPDAEMARLIGEYKTVRKSQKPGSARTRVMTRIMGQMIALAPGLQAFDVRGALKSKDQGRRLAAYACLYARPQPDMLGDLVAALTEKQQQAFLTYWGIQTVGRILQTCPPGGFPPEIRLQLREFLQRGLTKGTDRHSLLSRLLREFE